MANSIWQATAQNATGDIIPGAEVTVVNEATGLSATIYSDIGGTALANPFFADSDGFIQFYAAAGAYRVTAEDGGTGLSQTWRYIRLGEASSRDTGTATGQLPTADQLSMVGATENFTTANLNPNVFGADTINDRTAMGGAITSSIATFFLPTDLLDTANSITVVGTFDVTTLFGTVISGGAGVIPSMSSTSTNKLTNVNVAGLSGLADNTPLLLKATSTASKITVNS
jgi:hypothetical protein